MSDDKEIDLRGSIRNLKNIAKTLDGAHFDFKMKAMAKFVEGIKFEGIVKPPEDILKMLLTKFLLGGINFSSREIRALPFIVYEPQITPYNTTEILRRMDFSRTSHLRGVLSVYLLNYDDSPKTELLRRELCSLRKVDSPSLEKLFAAREYLFGNECFDNMTRLLAQKLSVNDLLEIIGLAKAYKTSNFIQRSLKNFFRPDVASLATQMKILTELDTEYDTYKNIFPVIADALIQTVARTGSFKKQCIEIFYGRLGDPRFGNSRFNWEGVSQRSRDIFCHWLSEEDLEVFFKIIKQTALDRMWRYREKFWRAYLPYIVNTKIFLGATARQVAVRLEGIKMHHGNLQSSEDNQSVFVFQIGQYIFSEWSHNGKLRIHREDNARRSLNLFDYEDNFFELNYIDRYDLMENAISEQIHSSPRTYSWQKKVSDWLEKNCGIKKTEDDWGLED